MLSPGVSLRRHWTLFLYVNADIASINNFTASEYVALVENATMELEM